MKYETGHWEIWIDDLDGEIAMVKTGRAKRDVLVVEEEVFERALNDIKNLQMVCRQLAAAQSIATRDKVVKRCYHLFAGSPLRIDSEEEDEK